MMNKRAGVIDALKAFVTFAKNKSRDQFSPVDVNIQRTPTSTSVSMKGGAGQPLPGAVMESAQNLTANNSNADLYRRILSGTAATGAAMGAYSLPKDSYVGNTAIDAAYRKYPGVAEGSLLVAPLAAYYTKHNLDRPGRAALGAAATLATAPFIINSQPPIDNVLLGAAGYSAADTADAVQELNNRKEIAGLMGSPDVPAAAGRINAITNKHDVRVRYPALGMVPFGKTLQNWYYGKKYPNNPQLTPEQRQTYKDALLVHLQEAGMTADEANAAADEKLKVTL